MVCSIGLCLFLVACSKTPQNSGQTEQIAQQSADLQDVLVATPEPIASFYLRDHDKSPFTQTNFKDKWTFLVFGYTNCPDICPTTLAEMDDLDQLLNKRRETNTNIPKNTQVVFVTLDPKRDTEKELKQYLSYFNTKFVGVTGSVDDIHKFCDPLGIHFSYEQITPNMYGVNHSSAVVLIDPKTRYFARFSAPHYAEDIADWFQLIIQSNHS